MPRTSGIAAMTVDAGIAASVAAGHRTWRLSLSRGWPWLLPALAFFLVFYVVPLAQMLWRSVSDKGLGLQHYAQIFASDIYINVLISTMKVGVTVALLCLIVGYPLAYFLSRLSGRWLMLTMIFVLIPFWISSLVRNYAWIVILNRRGIVNSTLMALGIIGEPLNLMYNLTGVIIGMSYVLMPIMILALYAAMKGIDPQYARASSSLGASPQQTFLRVFVPLSLPGIWAGSLLVFIIAIGFFITPAILGGGRVPMMATVIEGQVRGVLNWGFGSALGVLLLGAVLIVYLLFDRLLGIEYLIRRR
jgi:putative spermidine/putrescine transport system permease protein